MQPLPRNYTVAEVADLCRRSPATIRRWVQTGRIRPVSAHLPGLFGEAELQRLGLVPPPAVATTAEIRRRVMAAKKSLFGMK